MKTALLAALLGSAAAFAPAAPRVTSRTALEAVKGAAKSSAEDIELTLKVIMDNLQDDGAGVDDSDDDTPMPAAPAAAPASAASGGVELWSVDYDAAARLAYEAAGSKGDFAAFKTKYLADMSAMVGKKGLL